MLYVNRKRLTLSIDSNNNGKCKAYELIIDL